MPFIDPNIFVDVVLLISGAVGGAVGAKKLPVFRNGVRLTENLIDEIDKKLDEKEHTILCGKQQAEMKLYISKELEDHTATIVKTIRENNVQRRS